MPGAYLERYIDAYLDEVFDELPAVMLTGPRGCGKSTSALRRANSVVRLDEPEQAAAFAGQPDAFLERLPEPILLDEWQEVPESMAAVKRSVDAGKGDGRFLITGSVRARRSGESWPGTGRVTPITLYGLAMGEKERSDSALSFIDRIFSSETEEAGEMPGAPTIFDYAAWAAEGGFPEAVRRSPRAREEWFDGYIEQLVGRDVLSLAEVRAPRRMIDLLRAIALNTAGLPTLQTLTSAAGADAKTVRVHLDLLEDLGIVERLPAWHSNRLSRLVKGPKYHVVDTGLAMWLSGIDGEGVVRSADLLGRVLDSFVAAQLRPLFRLSRTRTVAHHLRDSSGRHEVDLLLESRRGDVVGIEIKAGGGPSARDARHLAWLRDELGDAFRRGIVFHTGRLVYPLGDRIWAMPIASIWR
ncbi:ATP-binding protein [Isoptericola cucumis]|uniref:ATP-binding protein n=1 Tax=Isoptericola cucumis TaxID=1776856 RepID=A0ABQ2B326_9MICO|nr:ATP-binding protein [Isoptericola cucumis]GGI04876.1 hypothetical protein GCM10007368_03350 [Isoptericola cucumis]